MLVYLSVIVRMSSGYRKIFFSTHIVLSCGYQHMNSYSFVVCFLLFCAVAFWVWATFHHIQMLRVIGVIAMQSAQNETYGTAIGLHSSDWIIWKIHGESSFRWQLLSRTNLWIAIKPLTVVHLYVAKVSYYRYMLFSFRRLDNVITLVYSFFAIGARSIATMALWWI